MVLSCLHCTQTALKYALYTYLKSLGHVLQTKWSLFQTFYGIGILIKEVYFQVLYRNEARKKEKSNQNWEVWTYNWWRSLQNEAEFSLSMKLESSIKRRKRSLLSGYLQKSYKENVKTKPELKRMYLWLLVFEQILSFLLLS